MLRITQIVLGNSNVCFGLDSELIEEELGMPVVDMGLHGGLGNAFHERMIQFGVSEGDIVIVCHTTFSDDDSILDPELVWITLEKHKELWPLIASNDYVPLLKGYPKYFVTSTIKWIRGGADNVPSETTCYSRSAFNEYGDIIKRFDAAYEFVDGSVVIPSINDTCMNRLNEMNQYVSDRGAALLVAGYPVGYGEYTPDETEWDAFEDELRSKLDCDVISHYADYFIPYELFYDTRLHLSEEGARIRTEQLIEDLKGWMNER